MIALSSVLRQVPVTILYGMPGSGKTTLLQQLLSEYKGGALAFVIVQPTEFNFDASLLRGFCHSINRNQDIVYEVREDDASHPWPRRLAAIVEECAKSARFDHLFIELSANCPINAAANMLESIRNIVCVIDALELLQEVEGRAKEGSISGSADLAASIVVEKTDLLNDDELKKCWDYLQALRPDAAVIEATFGEIPFDFLAEELVLPEMPREGQWLIPSEARVFSARRPFHPQRFHDLCFGSWDGIWRAKGFFWLATRMEVVGGFSLTGTSCSSGPGGEWWAAMPRDYWPKDPDLIDRIEKTWREPFGDRRQELVLIGDKKGLDAIAEKLQYCLLTTREMELGATSWANFTDPFPSWTEMES
jgi:G3E family GTPase